MDGAEACVADDEPLHRFLQFLVEREYLPHAVAQEINAAMVRARPQLGQLMLRGKLLTVRQLFALLDKQAMLPDARLGELAIREGMITREQIDGLLALQRRSQAHPAEFLVRRRDIAGDVLVEALVAYVVHSETLAATRLGAGGRGEAGRDAA
jgi:hypothetical protein